MAKKVENPEERERRIKLVGKYVAETGASTRKTAEYFTQNYFPISNNTVSKYIEIFKTAYSNEQEQKNISDTIKNNKPQSVEFEEVKKRVKKVADLVLEGFTIEEIAKSMNEDYWVIYRDIHNRLPKIDPETYVEIKSILEERSIDNLNDRKK